MSYKNRTDPFSVALNGYLLSSGGHPEGEEGEMCVLECAARALGMARTDEPSEVGLPDLRTLNDARWSSDVIRTENLADVAVAVWPWRQWAPKQRLQFASRLAILTVQRVLPMTLRAKVDADLIESCKTASTLGEAINAAAAANVTGNARGAYSAAAAATSAANACAAAVTADAAAAAAAAAYVVTYAPAAAFTGSFASAAAHATFDAVLIMACSCWIEAAREVEA